MAAEGRSQKSVINMFFSVGSNFITQLLHFIVRTIFLHILGSHYVGLDGLFTNILTMLSLADLGVGVAMAHTYYKPLADKDEEKIVSLVTLYSRIYMCIGLVIFLIGMAVMPFLPEIINDIDKVRSMGLNVEFIYFWYVLNTASSYMFAAYKQTLFNADQKAYVVKNIYTVFAAITAVVQIIFLVVFQNSPYVYYFYLVSNIVLQIIRNLYISYKCNKVYSFLNKKNKRKVLKEDIQKLIKDVYALFLYRVCIVVLSGTNNIIIARYVVDGLKHIGSYMNYTFLIGAVKAILAQIYDAITASVGNLVAEFKESAEGREKALETFNALYFSNFWLFGMCSVVLWVMLEPFVVFWLKGTDIIFISRETIFVLVLNFYIEGVQLSTTAFRNAYGFFRQGRYRPVIMTVLNLGLSIWLVQKCGMVGVFIGNVVSRLVTLAWFDPYVVFKYGFKKSVIPYVVNYYLQIFLLIGLGYITELIVNLFPAYNLLWLILRGIVATAFSNGVLFIIYRKSDEFKFIYSRVEGIFNKIRNKLS